MGYASLTSTSGFKPIEMDKRVLAEPGAEDLAKQLPNTCQELSRRLKKQQCHDFAKPVGIYVCASEGSFTNYTGLSKQARGAITTKVFLSGKLKI